MVWKNSNSEEQKKKICVETDYSGNEMTSSTPFRIRGIAAFSFDVYCSQFSTIVRIYREIFSSRTGIYGTLKECGSSLCRL